MLGLAGFEGGDFSLQFSDGTDQFHDQSVGAESEVAVVDFLRDGVFNYGALWSDNLRLDLYCFCFLDGLDDVGADVCHFLGD